MQVEKKALSTLLSLQETDLELLRAQKKLDELPQRKMILALREKKAAIETKRAQVAEMKKDIDLSISLLNDEDERLVLKQDAIQVKINDAKGDYRSIESFTRELGGVGKRRNTLESEKAPLDEKLSQIQQILNQATDAYNKLLNQETEVVASFKQEGGALTNQVARLQAEHEKAIKVLGSPLAETYEKILKRQGGIAVARLAGNLCSVCRSELEEGKLLKVKGEAPLSECPFCKRLMVVEIDD